jgi:hypothetical protein
MSFLLLTAALVTARAHISALEAKVKASAQAWENANVAKVSAEKAAKLAENRAKKLKRLCQSPSRSRPSGSSSWLNDLTRSPSPLAVSVASLIFNTCLGFHLLTCVDLFCLCLCDTVKKMGESWRLR